MGNIIIKIVIVAATNNVLPTTTTSLSTIIAAILGVGFSFEIIDRDVDYNNWPQETVYACGVEE